MFELTQMWVLRKYVFSSIFLLFKLVYQLVCYLQRVVLVSLEFVWATMAD
jgi:hypothetical protein